MNAMPAASAAMVTDRRRKAAMVVQLMLADGQKIDLSRLPEDVQVNLTRELAALRLVDRDTLHAVADEFAQALETVGLAAPGGVEGALAALSGQLSPEAQARLRREAAAARGLDPWATVLHLPVADLLRAMTRESIEVAAVVLSKLPVPRAAELLGRLPGDRARRITYAVSQTADVGPDTVLRIGRALAAEYGAPPATAFAAPPVQRVGAILNASQAATRDGVLESLAETDAGFAAEVRRAIFTFPDIPARVNRLDVPKVMRNVDNGDTVTALAAALTAGGAEAEAAEFILANMSQRMADTLREDIRDKGRIRKADGEKAQATIVVAIRDRADAGEIALIRHDEAEE